MNVKLCLLNQEIMLLNNSYEYLFISDGPNVKQIKVVHKDRAFVY